MRYTAIELLPADQCRLMAEYHDLYNIYLNPVGYRDHNRSGHRLGNHMTMNLGSCREPDLIGEEFILTIDGLGFSEKAVAVRVSQIRHVVTREGHEIRNIYCDNETPHITLFINEKAGGKPKDSNDISVWIPVRQGMEFRGVVVES